MSQPYNYYTGDGVTVAFEFTQALSSQSTVVGRVDYVSQSGTWDSVTGFFTFDVAPASGTKVHIIRYTSDQAMEYTFPNKSYIPDGSLDANWNQTRYQIEEVRFNDTLVALSAGSTEWQWARDWAITTEDTLVPTTSGGNGTTDYSSLHWAAKSAADAVATAADVVSTNADAVTTGLDVTYSQEWATKAEDSLISVAAGGDGATDYSAYHWAKKAEAELSSYLPLTGGALSGSLTLNSPVTTMSSIAPDLRMYETDQAVDERYYSHRISSSAYQFRALNDAVSAQDLIYTVERTGYLVDNFNFKVPVTMDSNQITGLPAVPSATGATSKEYVDILAKEDNANVIINGNFDISQRSDTFVSPGSGAYTVDRWLWVNTASCAVTVSAPGLAPTYAQSGVRSLVSLQVEVTTADTSIAATDFTQMRYKVEGYDFAMVAGGDMTLSFWVASPKTGVHCVSFSDNAFGASYVAEYTINAANTWEYKTITITHSEGLGSWNYTSNIGVQIGWTIAAGTNYHTTKDTWVAGAKFATSSQVNAVDTVGNDFRLSQVQLERGSNASIFRVRTYAEELQKCQRYYEKSYNPSSYPGVATSNGATRVYATNLPVAAHVGSLHVPFATVKRSTPTIVTYSPSTGASGQFHDYTAAADASSTVFLAGTASFNAYANAASSSATLNIGCNWTADAEL